MNETNYPSPFSASPTAELTAKAAEIGRVVEAIRSQLALTAGTPPDEIGDDLNQLADNAGKVLERIRQNRTPAGRAADYRAPRGSTAFERREPIVNYDRTMEEVVIHEATKLMEAGQATPEEAYSKALEAVRARR